MYKNLRAFRESLGMTQKEFAASLSIGLSTYNGYEVGAREPKSDFWIAVAGKYGVTIDYLMGFSDDPHKVSDNPAKAKNSSSYTDEEKELVSNYRSLDKSGKRAVQVTVADQKQRVSEERKKARSKSKEGNSGEEEARVIPLYYNPAAAGLASPAFGEDFEYLEVGGDVPAFADFAVKIDGNSMEPYIMDGSIVYVNHDPMVNGDVGIFYCDGDILCKQYAKDEEGNVNLISLNRDREDADRFIDAYSGLSFTCLGRVIMRHTVRLPNEFRE